MRAEAERARVTEAARVEAERATEIARMEADRARMKEMDEDIAVGDVVPAAGVIPVAPRHVDYLKRFSSLRVITFNGIVGSDIEAWFRQLDAAFRQLEIPEHQQLRLAETLLKTDAFDG